MRQIKLTEGIGKINGKEQTITTVMLISNALDHPPEKGFRFSDFVARKRIQDAIDKLPVQVGNDLTLEDADFETLKACVNNCPWITRSDVLFELLKTVQ